MFTTFSGAAPRWTDSANLKRKLKAAARNGLIDVTEVNKLFAPLTAAGLHQTSYWEL